MIITSLLTKFHQNPTSSLWEILLTNKQTNKQTNRQTKDLATQRFELSNLAVLPQCVYRLSYRAVLLGLLLSNYYNSPNSSNFIKIRPVVHEKQVSGFQIRISNRTTPNFELSLPMIITSLLTKFHQNPTSSLWEILLTNKQTDKQKTLATQRFELWTLAYLAQCAYRLSYRAVLIGLLISDYYYSPNSPKFIKIRPVVHEKQLSGSQIRISIRITPNFELGLPMIITSLLTKFHQNPTSSLWEILLTNKQTNKQTNRPTENFSHTEVWTLDLRGFSTMLLRTEL